MAEEENGGIVKKELFDEDEHVRKIGNNMKGISIAERRGFNNADVTCLGSPYVTIPSGISPSALLDSPMVLLPNAQAQLSPTTGTFHQFPLSPSPDTLNLKLNLANENNDTIEPINDNLTFEEYFEYQETRNVDTLAKSDNARISTNNNINQDQSKQYHQKASYVPKEVAKHSEDGFYWRKYGQKHVKGSEFPRSYYKCTNANCLVKKKVERSHAGEITQIVYKGSHNHPTPQPLNNNRRPNEFGPDHPWKPDNNGCLVGEINSSASILGELPDHQPPVETQDISSNTFGSGDGEDRRNQASPESISCKDEDDENNNAESEPKKRKRGNVPDTETSIPRSGRESKVVVQIESEVDILDDGYRWRKYGQKVVKGNPNPRSYYKCTTPRCPVRKHVERAADDIKSVLTTYEGKHNHDVPASKAAVAGGGSFPAAVSVDSSNQKPEHSSKAGKQAQVVDNNYHHLPMYMERKQQQQQPILSYNDFMRSSLPGHHHHHHDLGFGGPGSIFPYSFPPFPSLAAYNSLLMNGNDNNNNNNNNNNNHVKPFYMSMPTAQMNLGLGRHVVPNMGGNLGFNNLYAAPPNPTDRMRECEVVKPKEEQAEDEGESSYDHTCLLQQSIPNHGNGSL